MKLHKLCNALDLARFSWKLEPCHLELLRYVLSAGEVTIMQILNEYPLTSPATTHKNLKHLIKSKLLTSVNSPDDGRIRLLGKGTKLNELFIELDRQ